MSTKGTKTEVIEVFLVVDERGDNALNGRCFESYRGAMDAIEYAGPGLYSIEKRFLVTEAEVRHGM